VPALKKYSQNRWVAPHKRPIGFALGALFMLLLANIFPFINMRAAGLGNEISLVQIPLVMLAEDYAIMATLFIVFVQWLPAFCMLAIILLCVKVGLPLVLKKWLRRCCSSLSPSAW
jgi:paraquat-inducible protein A